MDLLGVDRLDICPWALREGVILRRLDWLAHLTAGTTDAARADATGAALPTGGASRHGGRYARRHVRCRPGARRPVALSTASVYPESCAAAFDLAAPARATTASR